jgi:hypothetical protein
MEFRARNTHVNARLKMSHDSEFRMPPKGITATRYNLGGKEYVKHGARCDVDGCWFAGGSFATHVEAEQYLADHKAGGRNFTDPCPAPPRRESLPSGLHFVEKLWRELDDVVEALSTGELYRGMTKEQAVGYAKGLAFSIVMHEPVHFDNIDEVSRHARDRRKMRLGLMDWSATPTSLGHNATTVQVKGLHPSSTKASTPIAPKSNVSDTVKAAIRAGANSGMFSIPQLAEAYSLTQAEVAQIVG